jgi:hypothetical protein
MEHNTIEIEVDGQKVGFKCGTLAVSIACRKAGVPTVQDLLTMMASFDLQTSLALLYGAHCQYLDSKRIEYHEFTMDMMSDIADKMTEEQGDQVSKKMLERFIPKNVKAPQATGANQ